ncbi:ATP-binding cassette domain-containing protein [Streptomyces ambofaciens]
MRDVSLTARPGETIGLVGPNGSGKSSLLRTVYRVLRPDTGQALVDGGDAWSLPVRQLARAVAAVVQDSAADFDLAVREVVAMGRTPHKRLLAAYTPGGQQDRRISAGQRVLPRGFNGAAGSAGAGSGAPSYPSTSPNRVPSIQSRRACSISSWERPIQFQNYCISQRFRRSEPYRSCQVSKSQHQDTAHKGVVRLSFTSCLPGPGTCDGACRLTADVLSDHWSR